MTKLPRFSLAFLHPRYWLSWAGIAALWLIMLLPYPLLFRIGHGLVGWRCACFLAASRLPAATWSFVSRR
jgi:lauroyl/myristoyl acyltransferase